MALGRTVHEIPGTDTLRMHVITDLEDEPMTLETTDRDLVAIYFNCLGTDIAYLKFWNILTATPDTEQVGPDLIIPMAAVSSDTIWFESVSSTGVRTTGLQNIFTTGMTIASTSTIGSGNPGSVLTQAAPTGTTLVTTNVTIITKAG